MTLSIRSSFLLGVLALALVLAGSALAGVLPIAPQKARAADETTEETTTTPEEPPPVTETPTEPTPTPEPETPTTTPPVTTPPVTAPSSGGEGGGGTVETPKSTPSPGTVTGGGGGGGSSSGGSSSGGSSGSGSTAGTTTTTTPATSPTRNPARTPTRTTTERNGNGGNSAGGGDSNSQVGAGGGGSRNTGGGGAAAGHKSPSAGGGNPTPLPTVSPQAIDEGASAVSKAASHVGEAFAEALPTAPLKKIGDQVAAHIASSGPAEAGSKQQRQTADEIGTALGAALIGSAVAVDRTPAASSSPIPFFTPPGGKSGTIYLILIAALVLAVGALVFREARSALGFDKPRTGVRVADEKPRIRLGERIGVTLSGVHAATHRWFSRARRLRANAAAGLRSLF